jgi:hypothetical protein
MLASCCSMLLRGRVLPIPVKSGTRNPAKSGRAEFREFGVSESRLAQLGAARAAAACAHAAPGNLNPQPQRRRGPRPRAH